jgi:hypothetical protein
MLERIAGLFIGILTFLTLGLAGLIFAVPDAGKYLHKSRM